MDYIVDDVLVELEALWERHRRLGEVRPWVARPAVIAALARTWRATTINQEPTIIGSRHRRLLPQNTARESVPRLDLDKNVVRVLNYRFASLDSCSGTLFSHNRCCLGLLDVPESRDVLRHGHWYRIATSPSLSLLL